jgi:tRNA-(ms[2]io[6]A)-hydroxylase
LLDHACCERKAAASALALIARHSRQPQVVEPMVALAREELDHFGQVYRLLQRRGLELGPDDKDPYVNKLLAGVRPEPETRLLDRLVASAFIEARSCERFQLVAAALPDGDLKDFYTMLHRAEAGHGRVFTRIAGRLFPAPAVAAAIARLAAIEAAAMLATPWRSAVH